MVRSIATPMVFIKRPMVQRGLHVAIRSDGHRIAAGEPSTGSRWMVITAASVHCPSGEVVLFILSISGWRNPVC